MYIKIMKSNKSKWYSKCIGERFKVHSERKGKYIVILEKQDRWLINGQMYGWVSKTHCILLKATKLDFCTTDFGVFLKEEETNNN